MANITTVTIQEFALFSWSYSNGFSSLPVSIEQPLRKLNVDVALSKPLDYIKRGIEKMPDH